MDNMAVKQEKVFFSNPLKRLEIRNSFPKIMSIYYAKEILKTINEKLSKQETFLR